jgi:hypothetical protein
MTDEEMVQFAVEASFGCSSLEWPDEYYDLSQEKQNELEAMFWQTSGLDQCSICSSIVESGELSDGYCEDCINTYELDFEESE